MELKEFGVPDVVKSMAWCGENICLGIRREYMIMNSITGALSEVFPSGRIAPPLVVPLPSGELLLGKVLSCILIQLDSLTFFLLRTSFCFCCVCWFNVGSLDQEMMI